MPWSRITAPASWIASGSPTRRCIARNPKLVYATIRGFGDPRTGKSPYSDWPAYDVVSQAMGGIMAITGPDKDTPMKVGPGVGDIVPAIMCAFGIVCAILRAHKTGKGQFVDVGMVDAILAVCERIVHQQSYENKVAKPDGNHHPLLCPFGIFPAKDGHVTIAAHSDDWWTIFADLMEKPEWMTDPILSDRLARVLIRITPMTPSALRRRNTPSRNC